MVQAGSLIWLVAGASLLSAVTRLTVPPATWLALTLLVHASRSMPAVAGLPYLWLALYLALMVGNRGILPVTGAPYLMIVGFIGTTMAASFAVDRLAVPWAGGPAST